MTESEFQRRFIKCLKERYPCCIVLKNDATYKQGFPDLIVLHGDKYAVFECKKDINSPKQPNQQYYIDKVADEFDAFAEFVYPENMESVLEILDWYFY